MTTTSKPSRIHYRIQLCEHYQHCGQAVSSLRCRKHWCRNLYYIDICYLFPNHIRMDLISSECLQASIQTTQVWVLFRSIFIFHNQFGYHNNLFRTSVSQLETNWRELHCVCSFHTRYCQVLNKCYIKLHVIYKVKAFSSLLALWGHMVSLILVIIGSDNNALPVRRQAIIRTNDDCQLDIRIPIGDIRQSYDNGISYTGKTTSLYWIRPQASMW